MNQIWALTHYVSEHPAMGLLAAVAAYAVYRLLNRKSRMVREADKRFEQLREERGNLYRGRRPPQ